MYDGETELLVNWCAINGREGYEWSMPIKSCRAVLHSSRLYASAAGARRAGCRAIKRLHPTWRIG